MNFNHTLFNWNNNGTEPSENLKANGFAGGYKPPASVFNYFWSKVTKAITELQTNLSAVDTAKVDKVSGKGLSTNDYTTEEKTKLAGIATGATKVTVDSSVSSSSTNPVQSKAIFTQLSKKMDLGDALLVSDWKTITKSGFYFDSGAATNRPSFISGALYGIAFISGDRSTTILAFDQRSDNCACLMKYNGTWYPWKRFPSYIKSGAKSESSVGNFSTAEGSMNTATEDCAHVTGYYNVAKKYQFVCGKHNTSYDGGNTDSQSASETILIVGCGSSDTNRKNALRITADGKTKGAAAFSASGADYAEYFEWKDGNQNKEDRRGYFVTLDGEKIRKATADDDFILGIVSTNGAFVGDSASEEWHNRYIRDVFDALITQEVEVPEYKNEETGEVIPAHTATQFVLNPEFDPEQEYISREFRKEWAPVGLLGKLIVIDDGTCQENGYCYASENGIATASETGYRVLKRIDESHVKILVK